MDILIETTRCLSINNKYQGGDSFRTYENKGKIVALEWDDFVLREQLKSLIYVDRSLRGDPDKDELIDELNFKNCVSLKRKTTSKLFVGLTYKKRKFIIHPEFFDANNIFSHPFIQNLKHKPNIIQDLSRQWRYHFKKDIGERF